MGAPSAAQADELIQHVAEAVAPFNLRIGRDIICSAFPYGFKPSHKSAAVVAFFGSVGVSEVGLDAVLRSRTPVLPVASSADLFAEEIPKQLQKLSCLFYDSHGTPRISIALLECLELLPRQRRVFVSYRRDEARAAALQLFNALSSRLFDTFLDTHGIPPADDFQATVWHRLCDSDVLIMVDTPSYFDSRWTSAEYGRALAKGISVLRIGWPGVVPSPRTSTASQYNLKDDEINVATGSLTEQALENICIQLEVVRCQSHAVRSLSLFSNLQQGVERIGGTIAGVGLHNAVYVRLPDGNDVVVYPSVRAPTSISLQDAADRVPGRSVAVLYDHIGLAEAYLKHLGWLGENIKSVRWVRASEAAWTLAGWDV